MHSDIAEGRACCRLLRELVLDAGEYGGDRILSRQLSIVCEIANSAVADDFFKAELAVALRLIHRLTAPGLGPEQPPPVRSAAQALIEEILEALDLLESRLQIIERMRPPSAGPRGPRPGHSTS